jgi:hypothetical protein
MVEHPRLLQPRRKPSQLTRLAARKWMHLPRKRSHPRMRNLLLRLVKINEEQGDVNRNHAVVVETTKWD